jgi:hypothetical protein
MPKVHDFLEMWQGIQNLRATEKESRAPNKQISTVGYISDTKVIAKASWSLFQHDGAAALNWAERTPLPLTLSAKDLPGRQAQILNVHQIQRINCHPVNSDEVSTPEGISGAEYWLNCNGDLGNSNDSEDDCAAEVESDMEQDNIIEDPESLQQRDLSAVPNVPGLIWPTQK